MSDWRFASISGYLTWTSPSLPDGGTELYSELSPTLIIGLQEQGDVLPVDFIKLLTITSVTHAPGTRSIELTRDGAPAVLLVSHTPEDAQEWTKMIQLAIGDAAGSQVKTSRLTPSTPTAATTQPAAAPPIAAPVPSMTSYTDTSEGTGAAQPSRLRSASRASSQDRSIGLAPAQQLQSEPFGAPATGSRNSSRPGSETGSLKLQLSKPVIAGESSQAFIPRQEASQTVPSYEQQSTLNRWAPPSSASSAFAQAQQQSCDVGHDFRPLSDFTGVPPSAKTTTITTHLDAHRPTRTPATNATPSVPLSSAAVNKAWMPMSATPAAKSATGVNPASGSLSMSSAAAASGNRVQASPEPFVFAGSASRPLPPRSAASISSAPLASSMSPIAPENEYLYNRTGQADTSQMPGPFSQSATNSGGAASMSIRKRSGMLVDVPPNPQVNRNVAPNVSAIWKEWTGPDGVLYVCHEPTGTLQRRSAETGEFETLVDGTEEINPQDMALRPYSGYETAVDVNHNVVKNLGRYGGAQNSSAQLGDVASPSVYRTVPVTSPRGQYSPSRMSQLQPLAAPRQSQSTYHGRRVHHVTLGVDEEEASLEHKIELLGGSGLRWNPETGQVMPPAGSSQADIGTSTLHRQWEHVRKILMQGRYFKKHALKTTTSSFRFVFLTSDNAYVVCVPTSQVLFHVNEGPKTFGTMAETIQYYGPESRAIALNTITHVSLGIDEPFVRNRSNHLAPENTFCIVSRTHAFILECNTAEEAKYFSDAWTFFLYHSKPVNISKNRTPQMKNPVTFGTRAGLAF